MVGKLITEKSSLNLKTSVPTDEASFEGLSPTWERRGDNRDNEDNVSPSLVMNGVRGRVVMEGKVEQNGSFTRKGSNWEKGWHIRKCEDSVLKRSWEEGGKWNLSHRDGPQMGKDNLLK